MYAWVGWCCHIQGVQGTHYWREDNSYTHSLDTSLKLKLQNDGRSPTDPQKPSLPDLPFPMSKNIKGQCSQIGSEKVQRRGGAWSKQRRLRLEGRWRLLTIGGERLGRCHAACWAAAQLDRLVKEKSGAKYLRYGSRDGVSHKYAKKHKRSSVTLLLCFHLFNLQVFILRFFLNPCWIDGAWENAVK